MTNKYRIHLSAQERDQMQNIIRVGKAAASKRQRAQILLAADTSKEGGDLRDKDIAKVLDVSIATVERTRCASGGRHHLQPSAARRGTLDAHAAGRPFRGTRSGGECKCADHRQVVKKMTSNPGR